MNGHTLIQPKIFAHNNGITINIPSKLLSRLWLTRHKEKGNASAVLKALDKAKGILPASHPDGVTYENQVRQEAEEHFDQLQW